MPTTTNLLNGVTFNELQLLNAGAIDANGDGSIGSLDNYVELYNTTGSAVDISGWEIWSVINNAGSASKMATIDASTMIGAGDYYTLVDNIAGVSTSNVPGEAQFINSSTQFVQNSQSTYALVDPGSNSYILIAAQFASDSITTMISDLETEYPSITRVGMIETYTNPSTDQSIERAEDGDATWETGDATPGADNLCFAAGTLIATPDGEVAVETLTIGDVVRTADGRDVPVKWIGRQTIVKAFAGERVQLVRIAAGTLGTYADLLVTGEHGMVVDGMVINAAALVNGTTISLIPLAETEERFTVYHVETEAHDVILANGAASESYLDVPGRKAFDNYAEYLTLYGAEEPMRENPMPRVASARLVPEALRARLAG